MITVSFTINDSSDAKKARTRVINFGVEFRHKDGDFNHVAFMRKLSYTNPCDSGTFFSPITADPILTWYIGLGDSSTTDFASLVPDTISNSYNGADHYSYCKGARVYSITDTGGINWAAHGWDGSVDSMLKVNLSASQTTEVS